MLLAIPTRLHSPLFMTVADSCFGSPTRIKLFGLKAIAGMVSASVAWHASSKITAISVGWEGGGGENVVDPEEFEI